ncbi:MAG: hypothetical protein LQ343_005948 [Gyalolechia ehrenbergii]|nr:MAG: hypothetical protein LQ343_005948 [Gyalolechia ehrenbergii]
MVLYQPFSRYDNVTRERQSKGLEIFLREAQPQPQPQNTDAQPDAPPGTKRTKTDPDTASVGSSPDVGFSSAVQDSFSGNIGSGWWLHNLIVKPILPVIEAARELVSFYNLVTEKAAAQLQAGAAELKSSSFSHGAVSLVLTGTDIIYWDWIIDFAMAMVDSTNAGYPAQYKSTVTSSWQQNTILVELFLGGSGAG